LLPQNLVGRRVELALEILERECDVEDVDVVLRDRLTARDAGHRGGEAAGRQTWSGVSRFPVLVALRDLDDREILLAQEQEMTVACAGQPPQWAARGRRA
jgi:hypothetical protein